MYNQRDILACHAFAIDVIKNSDNKYSVVEQVAAHHVFELVQVITKLMLASYPLIEAMIKIEGVVGEFQ